MGHFAKVIDGMVTQVIVAEQEFIDAYDDGQPGAWVRTSYNTRGGVHYGPDGQPDGGAPLRKNFAGIGFAYDPGRDAFIPPKPYPSWVLNEASCLWTAPVPMPQDGKPHVWDEAAQAWVEAFLASSLAKAAPKPGPAPVIIDGLTCCAECGEEIPAARLAALPGVGLCVGCAEELIQITRGW